MQEKARETFSLEGSGRSRRGKKRDKSKRAQRKREEWYPEG
jgi:hypothetical protein